MEKPITEVAPNERGRWAETLEAALRPQIRELIENILEEEVEEAWATSPTGLQPPSPTIQPRACASYRRSTYSSCPVLLHSMSPVTDPISSSPFSLRSCRLAIARRLQRYENKQYDLQYDYLGGRDEA